MLGVIVGFNWKLKGESQDFPHGAPASALRPKFWATFEIESYGHPQMAVG